MHQVVLVGGGFAGIQAAKALDQAPVELTVLDRHNYHLFQPLLYQVATGGLSPGDIASPIRAVLSRQQNARVLLEEVETFDTAARAVLCSSGARIPYDTLIVAAGSTHHYFGRPEWEGVAPGLKTVDDATRIRGRILMAFENAEREPNPEVRRAWLTFVVIGAGPTGVELAGTLAEIARDTLRHDFRAINPEESRILLLDAGSRVLSPYTEELSADAANYLIELGVRPMLGCLVTHLTPTSVEWKQSGGTHQVATRTILWAAGVMGSPLAAELARGTGCELDRAGRVRVNADLTVPGHPEIFVVGDMAYVEQDGKPLPGVAPVAMQQGRYAARVIRARLNGASDPDAFRYRDKGSMATIGRHAAVAMVGPLHFSGFLAWLAWLFIHIMYLVGFANRVVVLVRWAVNYLTFNRGARLITATATSQPVPDDTIVAEK
jgi:NADH dehydrogenase